MAKGQSVQLHTTGEGKSQRTDSQCGVDKVTDKCVDRTESTSLKLVPKHGQLTVWSADSRQREEQATVAQWTSATITWKGQPHVQNLDTDAAAFLVAQTG